MTTTTAPTAKKTATRRQQSAPDTGNADVTFRPFRNPPHVVPVSISPRGGTESTVVVTLTSKGGQPGASQSETYTLVGAVVEERLAAFLATSPDHTRAAALRDRLEKTRGDVEECQKSISECRATLAQLKEAAPENLGERLVAEQAREQELLARLDALDKQRSALEPLIAEAHLRADEVTRTKRAELLAERKSELRAEIHAEEDGLAEDCSPRLRRICQLRAAVAYGK